MRLSDYINNIRAARFPEKAGASVWGVSGGLDVQLPYIQAGWVNVADGQYTSGSPLTVLAGVKTQITIDGNGATTNVAYANGMHVDVWSENRFKPSAVGEVYNLRLTGIAAQSTSATGQYMTFEADIGTDEVPFIAATQTLPLIKGLGVQTQFTVAAPFFTLETFGLRGARLFITASETVTLWNAAIFIQRTFKP